MADILCEKAPMRNFSIFHFQFSQPQKLRVSIAFFGEQFTSAIITNNIVEYVNILDAQIN